MRQQLAQNEVSGLTFSKLRQISKDQIFYPIVLLSMLSRLFSGKKGEDWLMQHAAINSTLDKGRC